MTASNHENRIPGRARREFPYRHRRSLSRRRAVALPDLRGRAGRDQFGRGRSRHDPDRELGRRPRRRHPSSAAAIRPVHRRRMVPADPSSVDGAARRQARRYQDRGEPRPRARAMPPHHPQARHQADRIRRYRGQSARIVAERGDKSCASIASRLAADIYGLDILAEDVEDETHNTTRFVVLAREAGLGQTGLRDRWSRLLYSGSATCRPRSTRRWAALPPTAST